ncbi:MAG: LpxI family protein [Phycisphaerales bacterium]|nr:LpxI family protein [Phycisphaerales bacterium]
MIQAPYKENDTLGVIAGGGTMPLMVVEAAKQAGRRVVVLGLREWANPVLRDMADVFYWCSVSRFGRHLRLLTREKAYRAILAGSVKKSDMYGRFRILRNLPDFTTLKLWFLRVPDKRTDSILRTVADMMAERGIHMEHCVKYCMDAMATEGVLTKLKPSASQQRDIEFGWPVAKEMGRLDIGQSIAVKEQEVIAVEAIEGTDRMIERAGGLCSHGGWALIKVAKPDQDMRFDVPTVGPDTVENLRAHGAKILVIEADKTFIVDRDEMIARADRYGMIIVARRDANGA